MFILEIEKNRQIHNLTQKLSFAKCRLDNTILPAIRTAELDTEGSVFHTAIKIVLAIMFCKLLSVFAYCFHCGTMSFAIVLIINSSMIPIASAASIVGNRTYDVKPLIEKQNH